MGKKITAFGYVTLILTITYVLATLYYWINNPELTEMQVFIYTWPAWPVAILLALIGARLNRSE